MELFISNFDCARKIHFLLFASIKYDAERGGASSYGTASSKSSARIALEALGADSGWPGEGGFTGLPCRQSGRQVSHLGPRSTSRPRGAGMAARDDIAERRGGQDWRVRAAAAAAAAAAAVVLE